MFSTLDVLYIVLSFCVLWLTAALFWLVYQAAQMLRNVNGAVDEVRDKIEKIEGAITGMRLRFDSLTAPVGVVADVLRRFFGRDAAPRRGRKRASGDEDEE